MFQSDSITDVLTDPTVIRYIIAGIIFLVVVIICYSIHHRMTK